MAVAGTVFALTGWLPGADRSPRSPARSRPTSSSPGRSPRSSRRCSRTPPSGRDPTRLFGTYNTVATLAGSLGALIALRRLVAAVAARLPARRRGRARSRSARLSAAVEVGHELERGAAPAAPPLARHRRPALRPVRARQPRRRLRPADVHRLPLHAQVRRLAARRSPSSSSRSACSRPSRSRPPSASPRRIGLLRTMVFTHLPSNVLLAAIAFAPDLATAIALLLARFAALADGRAHPAGLRRRRRRPERAHRRRRLHEHRPLRHPARSRRSSPAARSALGLGAPFLIAGALKSVYDIGLYLMFRRVPIPPRTN